MRKGFCLLRIVFVGATGLLLMGCLLKKAAVPTRHFVLAATCTNEPAPRAAEPLAVGIGFVKMPSQLLRDSLAVQTDANEIRYLEDALWAERLDQAFQRTVAANLSRLLSSNRIYLSAWRRDQVLMTVYINVQQFDVDTRGRGKLIAQWRITAPGGEIPLKSGDAHYSVTGASPRANPEVIAATLSELVGDFSRDLAQSIRVSLKSSTNVLVKEPLSSWTRMP